MTLKKIIPQGRVPFRDLSLIILISVGILFGCQRSPSFNFGAYTEAERLYEKGKYEKALIKYQEYLRENPEGNMAVISEYYMAKSYDAMGDTGRARELYEKVAKEHPDLVWAGFSKTRLEELKQEPA